jgi:hypothetical protein
MHVEEGIAEGLAYVYCANTFDQRQLVMVDPNRSPLVTSYYDEIVAEKE